jgi:hypothetical protein
LYGSRRQAKKKIATRDGKHADMVDGFVDIKREPPEMMNENALLVSSTVDTGTCKLAGKITSLQTLAIYDIAV